ncbi:MAG: VWA domain-containing protein [Myxococcota bacterium]
MKRRTFFSMSVVGLAAVGTCSLWKRDPEPPLQLVSLSAQQSRQFVPAEVGTELWAVLRIDVDEGPTEDRPPVHVGLVVDTSGSMEGAPIEAARSAAAELIGSLQDGDRLTVVTFDSKAELVVANVEIDDDTRDESLEKVAEIAAGGTTDLAAGLHAAIEDLRPHVVQGRVTRLVLLSDGVPNDASSIPSAVAQASSMGITVTALGFGLDYDEGQLASIAQQTGGTFHFLEQPEALVPLFREENLRLQGIAAQEIVLTLTTGPNVELMEVVGQSYALPQPRIFMGLGDLSRGQERVVVVRLRVGPHRAGAPVELLDGLLTYRDPRSGQTIELDVFLSARAEDDAAVLAESIDPAVEREIENAKAAAMTLHAISLYRDGNPHEASAVLGKAIPQAAAISGRLDDSRLQEQTSNMVKLAEAIAEDEEAFERTEPEEELAQPDLHNPFHARTKAPAKQGLAGKRALRQAHGDAMVNFQARPNSAKK